MIASRPSVPRDEISRTAIQPGGAPASREVDRKSARQATAMVHANSKKPVAMASIARSRSSHTEGCIASLASSSVSSWGMRRLAGSGTVPECVGRPASLTGRSRVIQSLLNGIAPSLLLSAMLLLVPASSMAASDTAVWGSANAGPETTPDSIRQQTVGDTLLTARGYVAEFEDADPSVSTIIGPFSTGFVGNHQIFGPRTASATDANSYGLGLLVAASSGVAPSGFDYGGAAYVAGFDSGICCTQACLSDNPVVQGPPRQKKTDFTVITFSHPVEVSQFNTNTAPAWWAAGWTATPDLTNGLASACRVRA